MHRVHAPAGDDVSACLPVASQIATQSAEGRCSACGQSHSWPDDDPSGACTELEMMGAQAMRDLRIAEENYLRVFGWAKMPSGSYLPPSDLRRAHPEYGHQHAVNRQKSETITALRKRGRLPAHLTLNDAGEWMRLKGASGASPSIATHTIGLSGFERRDKR